MNVIIKIQEREAIPIRALPFVAGFEQFSLVPILPPYLIALAAGMPNEPSIGNGLPAYIFESNEVRQLAPNEWGAIIDQTDKPLNDAVRELPAGVFVFTDEFASWFKWLRLTGDQLFDPVRFQIYQNPLVPDVLHEVVMEGFGEVAAIDAADFHAIERATPRKQSETNDAPKPPRDKQRRQEKAIVEAVIKLGYDPKQLPKEKRGAHGVRSKVRDEFEIPGELFGSAKTFTSAWDRARFCHDIKSAE